MKHILTINNIDRVTHNVLRFKLSKPEGLSFVSGQAADIAINKPGFEDQVRAFTFTCLPEDDFLEFTIKIYPQHNGVTNKLSTLKEGDELLLLGVFGDISYHGEGVFIAGGAGVTPFISIFKALEKSGELGESVLLFGNKKAEDIIDREYFSGLLKDRFINVLSDEKSTDFKSGFIDQQVLQEVIDSAKDLKYFYLCGPDGMMKAVEESLKAIGIEKEFIIRENF